jgi:hypothetical protein
VWNEERKSSRPKASPDLIIVRQTNDSRKKAATAARGDGDGGSCQSTRLAGKLVTD